MYPAQPRGCHGEVVGTAYSHGVSGFFVSAAQVRGNDECGNEEQQHSYQQDGKVQEGVKQPFLRVTPSPFLAALITAAAHQQSRTRENLRNPPDRPVQRKFRDPRPYAM